MSSYRMSVPAFGLAAVLAMTARRSWRRCSASDNPAAAVGVVVIASSPGESNWFGDGQWIGDDDQAAAGTQQPCNPNGTRCLSAVNRTIAAWPSLTF